MNTQEILLLAPGPDLDAAVHRLIFHENGIARPYSTDAESGALLLAELPALFVTRAEKPKDGLKPWIAGTLAADMDASGFHTTMTVSGPTMLGVLCRAALLVALKSPPTAAPGPKSVPATTPAPPTAKRAATKRPNGALAPVSTPDPAPMAPKAKQRPAPAIGQPSLFLNSREKLTPLPKRKPFLIPGEPPK